jgi:hypothetical protein
MGGGGYDPGNLATAWCEVISALLEHGEDEGTDAVSRGKTAVQAR